MEFFAEQEVFIVVVHACPAKIIDCRNAAVFFCFKTGAKLSAQVPVIETGRLLAQEIVEQASAGGRWLGGWGSSDSSACDRFFLSVSWAAKQKRSADLQ